MKPPAARAIAPDSAIVRRIPAEGQGQWHPRTLAFAIDEDVGELDDLADEDLEGLQDLNAKLAFADGEQVSCSAAVSGERRRCAQLLRSLSFIVMI